MIGWIQSKIAARDTQNEVDREKMRRLEAAEQELASLRERGVVAVNTLIARNERNHWRESIEDMIHGRA